MDNLEEEEMGMGSRSEYVIEVCRPERGYGYCKRKGYEFNCRFVGDSALNPNEITDGCQPSLENKVYFFQINTDFLIRQDDEDEERFMGSEIYRTCMHDSDGEAYLKARLSHKLAAYWLPDDAIGSFVSGAFEFAKQLSVYFDDRLVIPVAVDLDVCTLQLDGETADQRLS